MKQIIVLKLGRIQRRLRETTSVPHLRSQLVEEWRSVAPKWKAAPETWTIS